jgi:hypothetical protein
MTRTLLFILTMVASVAVASESKWDQLVRLSNEYTEAQQKKLEDEYNFSHHERWDLNQETGELVFSNKGIPAVIAKFQFVGSFSETSKTWLWSWGNSSILPALSQKIEMIKQYGEKNDFLKLTERKWSADQGDGWEMAAITNYLLNAKGIYRPPFKQGATFIVITEIKKVAPK